MIRSGVDESLEDQNLVKDATVELRWKAPFRHPAASALSAPRIWIRGLERRHPATLILSGGKALVLCQMPIR